MQLNLKKSLKSIKYRRKLISLKEKLTRIMLFKVTIAMKKVKLLYN